MNLEEIDQNIFLFINSFVGKSEITDSTVKLLVNEYFLPTILSIILFSFWFYWREDRDTKQRSVLLSVLSVTLGSMVLVSLINFFIQRLRPFDVLDVNLLFYKPTDPSFPSNATVVIFALALSIFSADKKIGVVAIILASIYGFLRVFVGVHFPFDVLVGAFIGIASVVVLKKFDVYLMEVVRFVRKLLKAIYLKEFS